MCLLKISYCPICRRYTSIAPVGTPVEHGKELRVTYEVNCGSMHCFRNLNAYKYLSRTFIPSKDLNKTCGSTFCRPDKCCYTELYAFCCLKPINASAMIAYRLDSNNESCQAPSLWIGKNILNMDRVQVNLIDKNWNYCQLPIKFYDRSIVASS